MGEERNCKPAHCLMTVIEASRPMRNGRLYLLKAAGTPIMRPEPSSFERLTLSPGFFSKRSTSGIESPTLTMIGGVEWKSEVWGLGSCLNTFGDLVVRKQDRVASIVWEGSGGEESAVLRWGNWRAASETTTSMKTAKGTSTLLSEQALCV